MKKYIKAVFYFLKIAGKEYFYDLLIDFRRETT